MDEKEEALSRRAGELIGKYGELLTLEEVGEVLRFSSVDATRKAHQRKTLPVKVHKITGRQGLFATAIAVADYLDGLDRNEE